MSKGKHKSDVVRVTAMKVADKLRRGEIVNLDAELMGEDPESWLVEAAEAMLNKQEGRVKKALREAVRRGAGIQLELPGMAHAALPMCVFLKDEHGRDVIVPAWRATLGQMRHEVEHHRRVLTVQGRVLSGMEATIDRLDDLGVPDSMTGAEIMEAYPVTLELE